MAAVFSELLDLKAAGRNRFVAPPAPEDGGRMFGGQLLAQALAAAALTVPTDRSVHSLHAHFLAAGSVTEHTDIDVEEVRDGRSFSLRQVSMRQAGRELSRAIVSFHVPEPGFEHAPHTMPDVPAPEAVVTSYEDFVVSTAPKEDWHGDARPLDIRYVNPPAAAEGTPVLESQKTWIRVRPPVDGGEAIHAAGLAYLSDATLLDHALLPHGHRWHDPRLTGASLDHTMYFHTPARCDDWLLFDQHVTFTGGARGLTAGTLYSRTGAMVATCTQEGLIRWRAMGDEHS